MMMVSEIRLNGAAGWRGTPIEHRAQRRKAEI